MLFTFSSVCKFTGQLNKLNIFIYKNKLCVRKRLLKIKFNISESLIGSNENDLVFSSISNDKHKPI